MEQVACIVQIRYISVLQNFSRKIWRGKALGIKVHICSVFLNFTRMCVMSRRCAKCGDYLLPNRVENGRREATILRPGLHQRQKRRVANAAVGTRVWATVCISVFIVALSQFIYALPTVGRTQWRGIWDVDINATIDSCGICQMALGTLGVENAARAR
jgi:hypothetical protein